MEAYPYSSSISTADCIRIDVKLKFDGKKFPVITRKIAVQ